MSPRILIFSWLCSTFVFQGHVVLTTPTDIHDLLPEYGFPRGLIPNNVVSYVLSSDGFFSIQLEEPCYVHFDHLVYYQTLITGNLSDGSVSDVSGIQAKKLFLWLSVTGIKVHHDSGMLEFFVGALSQKLPAKQFENVPGCSRNKASKGSLVYPI
ncbi:uncharacterized protein LOC133300001 [Gastrolobium bilobum]|uniref:uncharacterized protein LOC133300001 n=1 Tax=Gastrolobium bilobum TaxID=150636 RepID=UPI002AB1DA8F|nr:uncharacterized protein LOC133300001 [Gastrolobium bilobum]